MIHLKGKEKQTNVKGFTWVILLGWTCKNWQPKWKEISSKGSNKEKKGNVNSEVNSITDELVKNNENAQLHESGLIIKYITKFKFGMVVL